MKLYASPLISACVIATNTAAAKLAEKDIETIHLQQIGRENLISQNKNMLTLTRESRREANAATYHDFERRRRFCEYDLSTNSRACFDIPGSDNQ